MMILKLNPHSKIIFGEEQNFVMISDLKAT